MLNKEEVLKLRKFADENNFVIEPVLFKRTFLGFIIKNNMKCFCDLKRTCPCPESIEEVKKYGKCLCCVLVSKEYYERYVRYGWKIEKRIEKKSAEDLILLNKKEIEKLEKSKLIKSKVFRKR